MKFEKICPTHGGQGFTDAVPIAAERYCEQFTDLENDPNLHCGRGLTFVQRLDDPTDSVEIGPVIQSPSNPERMVAVPVSLLTRAVSDLSFLGGWYCSQQGQPTSSVERLVEELIERISLSD